MPTMMLDEPHEPTYTFDDWKADRDAEEGARHFDEHTRRVSEAGVCTDPLCAYGCHREWIAGDEGPDAEIPF